jgi:branched-chain amino acid transport system permease protein
VTKLLQTFIDGVAVGSLYALIALGYTMVYGTLQFINFAHSDIFVWGRGSRTPSPWRSVSRRGRPSHAVRRDLDHAGGDGGVRAGRIRHRAARVSAAAPRAATERLDHGDRRVAVPAERGQLKWFFGTQPQRMPSILEDRILATVAGVQLHLVDVIGAATAVVLMIALDWLIFRTRMGRAMRAVSHDTNVAALMGVNVDAVISFTFVLGSSLAAAAGLLYAMKYPGLNQPAHATWVLLGLKAFVAAVIGGIGNIRGAMLGGILIGFIELFGAAYLSPHLRDIYVFSILILVLLVRPSGISAAPSRRRFSVPQPNSRRIRPPMHPGLLRCSSVKYSRYSPSSRLAVRAPRRPRC